MGISEAVKESIGSPEIGVTVIVSHCVGAGNEALVLWKAASALRD